jgi:transcription elongation GreA/GreB family factor
LGQYPQPHLNEKEIKMATTFLTRDGYRKLQEELDYLRTYKRQEIADRLHDAMDGGELIENAEYKAAKNEQAFMEGRIRAEFCCRRASIGSVSADSVRLTAR